MRTSGTCCNEDVPHDVCFRTKLIWLIRHRGFNPKKISNRRRSIYLEPQVDSVLVCHSRVASLWEYFHFCSAPLWSSGVQKNNTFIVRLHMLHCSVSTYSISRQKLCKWWKSCLFSHLPITDPPGTVSINCFRVSNEFPPGITSRNYFKNFCWNLTGTCSKTHRQIFSEILPGTLPIMYAFINFKNIYSGL